MPLKFPKNLRNKNQLQNVYIADAVYPDSQETFIGTVGNQFGYLYVNNINTTNQSVSNINTTNITASNLTSLNSLLTNSSITNLLAINETVSNLNSTNTSVSNMNATNITTSNLRSLNSLLTNSSITNLLATNITATNLNALISASSIGNSRIVSSTMSNSRISAVILTSSTLSNCLLTNFFVSNTMNNSLISANTINSNILTNNTATNTQIINSTISNSFMTSNTESNSRINTSTIGSNIFTANTCSNSNVFPESARAAMIYNPAYPLSRQPLYTTGSLNYVVGNLYYITGSGLSWNVSTGTLTNTSSQLKEGMLVGFSNIYNSGSGNQAKMEVLIDGATSAFGALKYEIKPSNNSTSAMFMNSYTALQPGSTLNIQLNLNGNIVNSSVSTYFTWTEFNYTNPFSSFQTFF